MNTRTTCQSALRCFVLSFFLAGSVACQSPTQQSPAPVPARIDLPVTTPAQQKLSTMINAIRTNNPDSVTVLIRNNMSDFLQQIPIDEHIDHLLELNEGMQSLDFHSYVRDEPHAATATFYNAQIDEWINIGVEVESNPPHSIFLILTEPSAAP